MRTCVRVLTGSGLLLMLAVCLLSPTSRGGEKENATILKMADAVEKGDAATVQKEVAAAKEMALPEIMYAFEKRGTGIGFGPKPGVYDPDGIEGQLIKVLAKMPLPAADVAKKKDDILRAAHICAAVAELTATKCTVMKKTGVKDPQNWADWSKDMKDASLLLAEAAKKGNAKAIKDAASKLNASCNNCHAIFRD